MNAETGKHTVDRNSTALALSGGGNRAALYHAGALTRLNELGLLTQISRISSVSGGSITSGMLAAAWPQLNVTNGVITNLEAEVVAPIRAFCSRSTDVPAVAWGALLPGVTIGDRLIKAYEALFKGVSLRDLPDRPQFVFNATNLQTGRLVRLQKVRLAEYTLGEIPNPNVRLAVAVAASSAFPPVLSPVTLEVDPSAWTKLDGAFNHGKAAFNRHLSLTDGGAYDNLGLETVDDFATIIVSDAGAPFSAKQEASSFWPKQAMRALDIATDQARALRKRLLFAECAERARTPVYAGIDSFPHKYPAAQAIKVDPGMIALLSGMRTRLNPFSEEEQARLINWGWLMMDVAARSYIAKDAPPPQSLPIPKFSLS
ncbi:patatin-like phospholipase family protein [Bosea sp. 685]|uniref:patatin-like phospholipase family protein n=1 Tax=Bosea sp. 685 TaxID=3080057 RepID=UPI002892E8D8|nr:patatin-like phospholipase family protein [Bosea sp. 685]WNJ89583.1 patatin-like phospholipase family protein [Bosea sp. 685]